MRLSHCLLLGGLLLSASTVGTRTLRAQGVVPEFRLDLRLTDTLVSAKERDTVILGGRAIGYDPHATDSCDTQFSEDAFYPASGFGTDLYFDYPKTNDQTRIDIRPKYNNVGFRLYYTMHASFVNYPDLLWGSILWDPSQIPSQVSSITITQAGVPGTVLADMKKQNSFTISPAMQKNGSNVYTITVYYRDWAGVASSTDSRGLLGAVSAWPNPMAAEGTLSVEAGAECTLSVTATDILGRQVLAKEIHAGVGENVIDLHELSAAHGTVLVRVDAETGSQHASRTIMVVARP